MGEPSLVTALPKQLTGMTFIYPSLFFKIPPGRSSPLPTCLHVVSQVQTPASPTDTFTCGYFASQIAANSRGIGIPTPLQVSKEIFTELKQRGVTRT